MTNEDQRPRSRRWVLAVMAGLVPAALGLVHTDASSRGGTRFAAAGDGPAVPASAEALSILAAAVRHRDTQPVVIATAGSSTTAGANATRRDRSYVHLLARRLQDVFPLSDGRRSPGTVKATEVRLPLGRPGIQIVNFGTGGTRSEDYLDRGDWQRIADMKTSMVLHMIGANDYSSGVTPATYRANLHVQLQGLRERATAPCVHVLVQSYRRADRHARAGHVAPAEAFREVLRSLAAESPQDTVFVDLSAAYEEVGVPGPDPLGLMHRDRIHQTDAGHAFMADLLCDRLGIPSAREVVAESTEVSAMSVDAPRG